MYRQQSEPAGRWALWCLLAALAGCGSGGGGGGSNTPVVVPAAQMPNRAFVQFTDVSESTGIAYVHGYERPEPTGANEEGFSGGAAAGDCDGDGDTDLFIVRGDIGPSLLYRNDGGNRFTDIARQSGIVATLRPHRLSGPTFADMDGDGDLDLFVGGILGDPSFIFRNRSDEGEEFLCAFEDVTASSGIAGMTSLNTISAAFGDYDRDGDLDMYLAHWGTPRNAKNPGDTEHLWRNISDDSGIRFESVSVEARISPSVIVAQEAGAKGGAKGENHDYTFTPTFSDINQDGWLDILSVADFNTTQFFVNDGAGAFINRTNDDVIIDRAGMGSAVGDYDNDGDMDWFVSSIYSPIIGQIVGNRLYENHGGVFVDATDAAGVIDGSWGWGACFADFNRDGWLDLYHTNGWNNPAPGTGFETDASRLFISDRDGTFTERAAGSGTLSTRQGRGVVCADFDNDGDVDIFVVHRHGLNPANLYRNDTEGGNWLSVQLKGSGMNTEGGGAVVEARIGDAVQTREVHIGSNFVSQNPTRIFFGLGDASQVDRLTIHWLGGAQETHEDISANQLIVCAQQAACAPPP